MKPPSNAIVTPNNPRTTSTILRQGKAITSTIQDNKSSPSSSSSASSSFARRNVIEMSPLTPESVFDARGRPVNGRSSAVKIT